LQRRSFHGISNKATLSVLISVGTLLAALPVTPVFAQTAMRTNEPMAAQDSMLAQTASIDQATSVAPAPMRLKRPVNHGNVPSEYTEGKPFQLNARKLHIQAEEELENGELQPLVPSASSAFPPPLSGRAAQTAPLQGHASEAPKTAPQRMQMQNASPDRAPFRLNADQGQFNLNVDKSAMFNGIQNSPLKGNVSVQLLSQYDVELIVDESNSMRRRDCPGGLSRWEWCGMQARNLSNLLAPFVPRGLTLSTFASGYNVYENSKPNDIVELFDQPFFSGGTRLSRPLRDRLTSYFRNRRPGSKPVIIGVITDGVPVPRTEPRMVAETLIAATQHMQSPHEVTVVFFQIGGTDFRGRHFLEQMDNRLVDYGAKYDFVKTVTFEQLQADGLAGSMVKSIQDFASRNQKATR
jgi:hypothetical protein